MSVILVQTRYLRQKIKALMLPTACALLLSACTGTSFFTNPVTESLKQEAYATSEFYVNKISQTTKIEEQQSYRLLAVRKLLDENKVMEAKNLFAEITPELNPTQKLEYSLISAQLLAAQKQNQQATSALNLIPFAQLSSAQALRYYQTFAKIAENQKDLIEAVRARIMMTRYLKETRAKQENNDKIWALLRNTNQGILNHTSVGAGEAELAGWLSLVLTYNQYVATPNQLPQSITAWKQQYPSHSAALLLPTELQNITNFQQTQLNSVALMLPLSGDGKILGEMIKKGFNDAKGAENIALQILDTDSAPVEVLISQAKQRGAQTIVGPLLKPRVNEMLSTSEINGVNVLALNATLNARAIAQVCYYGLSPESEARSAADRLYRDGIKQPIVAAPRGDYGERSADAFVQRWLQLTNSDVDVRYYNQPLDVVSALQNNGISQGGLYILGSADQVLELKQALDSSPLAEKLAIYASSRSNSPNNGADFRLAMNGVIFSEIPLLAETSSDAYKKVNQLAQSDFSMMRLYAMGSDAWSLANRFNELRQIPGYGISGLTGYLTAGPNCNIERGMTWLQYRNGALVPVN